MIKQTIAAIAFLTPIALGAQGPCMATVRELARVTPRTMLALAADSTTGHQGTGRDGAVCAQSQESRPFLLALASSASPVRARILAPVIRMDLIGGLPELTGTGGAWLGRGANVFVRLGAAFDAGPVHAVLVPEVARSANRPFDLFASANPERSSFASPWYDPPWSADLPSRRGVDPVVQVMAGQTAAWVSFGPLEGGVAASSQQWGPGRRGGLVIGADAPGIPRAFLRTGAPVSTAIGTWSFTAFAGTVTESRFFDRVTANDRRGLTGVTASWSGHAGSPLTVGLAHATMTSRHRAEPADSNGAGIGAGSDQMNSLFVQVAGGGSRAYAELARAGALPSAGRFLEVPYAGVVYLAGLEHSVVRRRGTLLVAAEVANLEQPTDVRGEPSYDLYTSRRIPQGWTHRGRVLGYPTGPGSNHASFSLDWVAPGWSAGLFGSRTRWNDDALYRQYLAGPPRHDVSMRAGIRGGYIVRGFELTAEASIGKRLNYLFQNALFIPDYRTVDVSIPQLRLGMSPLFAKVP